MTGGCKSVGVLYKGKHYNTKFNVQLIGIRKEVFVCIGWISQPLWCGVTLLLRIAWGLTPRSTSPEASESFLFVSCCFLVSCQCTFRKFSLVKSLTDKEIVTFFLLNPIEFGGLCHRICNLYWPSANTGVFHVTITDDKDL